MRKSRFEDVGTFGSVIPDFSAESVDLLDRKAEIALRQRYDFELKCAIELKRREEAEKSSVNANLLKERAKACASAYPLRNFIYESFPIIEKGREFKNNWHIDAISEVLQAATIGEVKNAIVNIPRRTMKPLDEECLVLTGNGKRKKLKHILIGETVVTHEGRTQEVTAIHEQGELECLKITTFNGREIISALDHPFLTPQGWIEAGNLEIGQSLATVHSPKLHAKSSHRDSEFTLAGYFIGDGCTARSGQSNMFQCSITSQTVEYIKEIFDACQDLGFTAICKQRNNNVKQINISNGARDWLREIDLAYKTSYTKTIPPFVYQGTNEQIAKFISAYFNCDGNVSKPKPDKRHIAISFTSVSRGLLEGTQHLLLRLGIRSRLRKKVRKLSKWTAPNYVYYMLDIGTNEDYAKFFEVIPISSYKKAKLAEHKPIQKQFTPKYFADEIVSIENVGKRLCRCLSVENDASFTANDLVVHNSLLVCVMWQSWVWTFLPQTRWVFISYSAEFAKRDNEKTKELLLSKYYQDRWGSTVRLTTERRGKLENTAGGFRVVFRVGQGLGEGGDFMIADDPNAVNEVESEAILEKTNRGWDEVGFHNVTDRATAIRFIMQQRTAPNDLTGHIVDDAELSKLYNHLCLAMKFDPEHPYGNSISKPFKIGTVSVFDKVKDPEISDLEIGEEKLWIDPRSTDAPFFKNKWYQKWYKRNFTDKGLESKGKGQLLWETYLTADLVAQDIAHLKAHGEHSQFQQLPTRRGGNFFNSDLFLENGKAIDPESIDYDNMSYCRFWDKAGTLNAGDWTVGMLVGVTNPTGSHLKAPRKCYIFDIVRVQRGFYSRMDLMVKTAEQDVIDYVDSRVNTSYCVAIEVEPASGGKDVSTIEKDALLGYDVRSRKARGTKAWRAETPRRTSEAGRLKLIRGDWNSGFISRLERFNPALSNNKDDEIDTLSGALKELLFTTTHKSRSSSGY